MNDHQEKKWKIEIYTQKKNSSYLRILIINIMFSTERVILNEKNY